jgi:HK97 family phage major capsid protein
MDTSTYGKCKELREHRAALIHQANVILNKSDHTQESLREIDNFLNQADVLAEKISRFEGRSVPRAKDGLPTLLADLSRVDAPIAGREHQEGPSSGSGERWADETGREIRLLGPADSFRSRSGDYEQNSLSLGRTLRGIVTSDWQGATQEQRALSSGGTGAFLLDPSLGEQFIDLARAQSTVLRAGARVVQMEKGTMTLARLETDPSAAWRPESVAIAESTPTFGRILLKARTVGALVKIPIELAADAANVEALIVSALTAAVGLELDRVLLYGDGASEPKGLRNYIADADQPIATQDPTGPLVDYTEFSLAQQGIKQANFQANAAIMSPRSWGQLDRAVSGITNDKTPLTPPQSWGELQKFVSSQVLDTFNSTESDAFVGQFDQLLVGIRSAITVEATRQAGNSFEKLEVWVRAFARVDAALARSGAFQIITGIEA